MRPASPLRVFWLAAGWLLLGGGCSQVLGIDGDYHAAGGAAAGGGGAAGGGSGGDAGSQAGGGSGAEGGGGQGGGLPTGEPCSEGSQCVSGFCVDDHCCESLCDGTCVACSAAKTGGDDGICGNVPAGIDPDAECPGGHNCDGNGACD